MGCFIASKTLLLVPLYILDGYNYTSDKQLCMLQFSAHEAPHVVVNMVNVGQINMTKIIMKHFNCIKYMIFLIV